MNNIEPMKITYEIDNAGDSEAGLPAYQEEIQIYVHSGDPGGEPGEFQEHMRVALAEWFDGAKVSIANARHLVPCSGFCDAPQLLREGNYLRCHVATLEANNKDLKALVWFLGILFTVVIGFLVF
jgi:hypothetical protein